MPYENINELPKSVRNLPSRAKTIYMKAFNSAWDEYADSEDDLAREKDSHEAAWSAVKEEYKKDEETGEWVKISDVLEKRTRHVARHRRSRSPGTASQARAHA
ncbi:MAG: ChaB family protein [Methanotrichaceae archaeon]